jgi:hypothetical protein
VPDGTHTVQVRVLDAADNATTLPRGAQLRTDNHAPAAPAGLTATSGATSATNRFDLSWAPPADAGAPITAARYQLCDALTAACGATHEVSSATSIDGLALAAADRPTTVRVWLVDALGHADPGTAAALTLVYDAPDPVTAPGTSALPPATAPGPTLPIAQLRPANPQLRLTTVTRSDRRIRVSGRASTKASGRVTVRYSARVGGRTRTLSRTAALRQGRFKTTLTLSRALARARTGKVTVRYAGDGDTTAASRTATVRLRRR